MITSTHTHFSLRNDRVRSVDLLSYIPLFCVLVIGFGVRYWYLDTTAFGIESDEAIIGLMAKHITEGRPWPTFYYGQNYMGSLEAFLVALVFLFTGPTVIGIKLVPLICAILHIFLVYLLGQKMRSHRVGLIAALFTAIGPSALIVWGTKARGGFIELVSLGTIALILTVMLLKSDKPRDSMVWWLGLVLGVGWWLNNQIAYYMLPIGVTLAIWWLNRCGFRRMAELSLLCLLAFFIGGLPFWYANITGEPQWSTFEVLFAEKPGRDIPLQIYEYFTVALPIIVGARKFWTEQDVVTGASIGLLFLYFCAIATLSLSQFRHLRNIAERRYIKRCIFLMLFFIISVGLIFSTSSFGWLTRAPRYLLPLYSVTGVMLALFVEMLWQRKHKVVSALLLVGVLSFYLYSFSLGIAPGEPVVYQNQRVMVDHQPLYQWLRAEGYRHIYTNYWIGYRTAFETQEQVTFTRFGTPRSLRIPEYELRPYANEAVYVLVPAEAALFAQQLRNFGYTFRMTDVSGYMAIDRVAPKWKRGSRVDLASSSIDASHHANAVPNMIDGMVSTRWGSAMPQNSNMNLRFRFDEAVVVSSLDLIHGAFTPDTPRHLIVRGQRVDGTWLLLSNLYGAKDFLSSRPSSAVDARQRWSIYFEPQELIALELQQQGTEPLFDWSIAEIELYEAIKVGPSLPPSYSVSEN